MGRLAAAESDDAPSEDSQFSAGFGAGGALDEPAHPLGETLVLGDYILEEQIAHGGMGVVYRAHQVSLARTVAVKLLLLGRYSSPDSIRRFHREAQAAAALRHPNIVSVFEVGECESQPFLAMEFVDGPSLSEVMKLGPLPPPRASGYARSLADALDYAHAQGVLHRDIKPSNVLVDAFDQVRLTDFGLAKKLDGTSDMTLTGQMIGSPNYLSPEQAAGKQAEIGPRSDIYGIGALLYELLTGRPPFMAQSLHDTLLHIRETDPVPPADLNPAVPRDLNTITLKCLEKVPARRYESARELSDDLGRFLRHEPISARPISLAERIWKTIRRHRMQAGLIATALGSLICLTGGSLWFGIRVDRARAEVEAANRQLAQDLFVREWHDTEQLVEEGKLRSALAWFARVVRQNPTNVIAITRLLGLLGDQTINVPAGPELAHPGPVFSIGFSADGSRLVTGSGDGKVRVWSWRDRTEPRVLTHQFCSPPAVSFLPGHNRIVVADRETISLWSDHGMLERSQAVNLNGSLRWGMTRDGRRAALVASAGEPQLWDPGALKFLGLLNHGDPVARAAPISPDGRYVIRSVAITAGYDVGIFDVDSGVRVWWLRIPAPHHSKWMYSGAFSDDSRLVALSFWGDGTSVYSFKPRSQTDPEEPIQDPPLMQTAVGQAEDLRFFNGNRCLAIASDRTVYVCDLETGELLPSQAEHSGRINVTSITPDGTTLATASVDGTVRFWDLRPELPKPLSVDEGDEVWDVAFAPDSTWFVASGTPNAEVRDARTGALLHKLPMDSLISCVEVSPDGRRIATCTERGALRVWDSATGEPVIPLLSLAESHHDLSFSADGRWVCVGAPTLRVRLIETETGKPAFPPLTADGPIVRTIITPDQKTVISGTVHGHVHLWSLPDGQRRLVEGRHKGVVWTTRLSRDGTLLATASGDQTTRIWEIASGNLRQEFRSEHAAYNAVFSPDGRRILIGSGDRTARIRDIESGRQVSETMRHPGRVWYTEFSLDGRLVLTGDDSGAARLWDAESGMPLSNWLRSRSSLKSVHFSPDGRRMITSSSDHTVKLWPVVVAPDLSPPWLPQLAEAIAGRRLDDDGTLHLVPFETWHTLRNQLATPSDQGFYSRWVQWFLTGRDRTNSVAFLPKN